MRFFSFVPCGLLLCFLGSYGSFYSSSNGGSTESLPAVRQDCIDSSDLLKTYGLDQWTGFLKENNGYGCFLNGESVLDGYITKSSATGPSSLLKNFENACKTIHNGFTQAVNTEEGVRANRYSLLFFFTAVNLVRGEQPPVSGYLVSSLLDLAASGIWDSAPTAPLDWAAGLEKNVPDLTTCIVESFAYSFIARKDPIMTKLIFSIFLKILCKNEKIGTQQAQLFVCMIKSTTVDEWIAVEEWFRAMAYKITYGKAEALPSLPASAQSCIGNTEIKNTRLLSLVSDSRQTVVDPVVSTRQYSRACINMLTQDPRRTTKNADLSVVKWILQMFRDPCNSVCEALPDEAKMTEILDSPHGRCHSLLANADSYAIMKQVSSRQVWSKSGQIRKQYFMRFEEPPENRCGKSVYEIYSLLKQKPKSLERCQVLPFRILMRFIDSRFFTDPRPLELTCSNGVHEAMRNVAESMGLFLRSKSIIDSRGGLSVNTPDLNGGCSDLAQAAFKLIPLATSRLFSPHLLLIQKSKAERMELVSLEHSFLRGIAVLILKSALPNRKLVNEIKGLKLPLNCGIKCTRYFYLFTSTAFQLIVDRRDHLVSSTDSDGVTTVVEKLLSLASNPSSFVVNAGESTDLFDWTVNVRNDEHEIVQGFRTAIVSVYAISEICQTHYASYDIFDLFPHLVDGYLSPGQVKDAEQFVTNFATRTMLFSQKELNCGDFLSLGLSLYQNMLSHGTIPNTETIRTLIPYVSRILKTGDFSDIFNSRYFPRFVLKKKNLVKEWITLSQLLIAETGLSPKTFIMSPSGTAFVFLISAFYAWDKFNFEKDREKRNALVAQLVHFARFALFFCFEGEKEKCLTWTTKVKAPRLTVWAAILLALSTAEKYFVSQNGAQAHGIDAFILQMSKSLSKDPAKAKKLVCLCENTPLAELRKHVRDIASWLVTQEWPVEINGSCP